MQMKRLLGAVGAMGVACATGLDVTDEDLAAICADPQIVCADPPNNDGDTQGGLMVIGTGGTGNDDPVAGAGNENFAGVFVMPPGGSENENGGGPAMESPQSLATPSGDCGSLQPAVAIGGCTASSTVRVLYTDRTSSVEINDIRMTLNVENSAQDFSLNELVLRYWFSADGETDFAADIDFAQIGRDNVCVSFGSQGAQSYADIGFGLSDSAGAEIRDIQIRMHTPNFAQLNQGNDFSYVQGATNAINENVTAYVRGVRVGGCEPAL